MDEKIIYNYLTNKLKKHDFRVIYSWFKNSSDTEKAKQLLYNYWESIDDSANDDIDLDQILNEIQHKICSSNEPYKRKTLINKRIIKILTNVAAVVLLPILGAIMFAHYVSPDLSSKRNDAYNEIFSSVDAITKVFLPDGSHVWLNHNSSLKYPASFSDDSRTVELKGEGYFDIFHNEQSPFIVETGGIQIVALGTVFNVMSYSNDDKIVTSLLSGKLKVVEGENREPLYIMKPGEITTYFKENRRIQISNSIDDRYYSWKDGKLKFQAEPMNEVIAKLSRWFNIDFIIADPELNDLTVTATFINESLNEVLELLSIITPVKYSITNRIESGTGTYSKRRVILKYSKGKRQMEN